MSIEAAGAKALSGSSSGALWEVVLADPAHADAAKIRLLKCPGK